MDMEFTVGGEVKVALKGSPLHLESHAFEPRALDETAHDLDEILVRVG